MLLSYKNVQNGSVHPCTRTYKQPANWVMCLLMPEHLSHVFQRELVYQKRKEKKKEKRMKEMEEKQILTGLVRLKALSQEHICIVLISIID